MAKNKKVIYLRARNYEKKMGNEEEKEDVRQRRRIIGRMREVK